MGDAGPIAKRDLERLGTTDTGVILFRNMLKRELEKVEAGRRSDRHDSRSGEERRDRTSRSSATRRTSSTGSRNLLRSTANGFTPIADDLVALFEPYNHAVHEKKPSVSSRA